MTQITASLVKELREKSGAGMMDCKSALIENKGDIDQSIDWLRTKGITKAAKKSERVASEGLVGSFVNKNKATIIELNSETDFVARDESYVSFTKEVVQTYSKNPHMSLEQLLELGVEDSRERLVQKLGENIIVRRVVKTDDSSVKGCYLHSNHKIGCIVSLDGGDEELANDIAMHASATDPMAVSPSDIPDDVLSKEREIFKAQSEESGKPPEIIEKMIEGKIAKFLSEVSLTDQDFVKDPNIKINQLLKEKNANILSFTRYEVGEGVEVKKVDFATEVMSQIEG